RVSNEKFPVDTKKKKTRDEPAEPPADADAEFVVAKKPRPRTDQPRDHRRVVEIAEVDVLCIVPVIRFLREKLGLPEINQPQQRQIGSTGQSESAPAIFRRNVFQ